MKHRWIIRGFFIGLLLLFVSAWAAAISGGYRVREYKGRVYWILECHHQMIHFTWWGDALTEYPGSVHGTTHDVSIDRGQFLPFGARHQLLLLGVPFWAPTTLCAALLLLVWQKTRPNQVGRGFPVEVKQSA